MGSDSNNISSGTALIPGGYYIVPRKRPEIQGAPPVAREVYDYLNAQANYENRESSGRVISRGQCVRTYEDIQEGLVWYVGFRKMKYSKDQIENALKWLEKHKLITKVKTTRGLIITIEKYDFYQTPGNYENRSEDHKKTTTDPQPSDTINKKIKEKKEKNIMSFSGLSTGGLPDFFSKQITDLADDETDVFLKYLKKVFKAMCQTNQIADPRIYPIPRDKIIDKLVRNNMTPAQAVNFLLFYNKVLLPSRNENERLSLLKCFSPSNINSYYAEWNKLEHSPGNKITGQTDSALSNNRELIQIRKKAVRKEIIRHYRSECKIMNIEPKVSRLCPELAMNMIEGRKLGLEDAKNLISFAVRKLFQEEGILSLSECLSRYRNYRSAWEQRKHLFENREKPASDVFWWED